MFEILEERFHEMIINIDHITWNTSSTFSIETPMNFPETRKIPISSPAEISKRTFLNLKEIISWLLNLPPSSFDLKHRVSTNYYLRNTFVIFNIEIYAFNFGKFYFISIYPLLQFGTDSVGNTLSVES